MGCQVYQEHGLRIVVPQVLRGEFSHLNHGDFLNIFLLFVYFWLHWVFIAVRGLSLVVASGRYSLAATLWLLVAVTSLVAEPRL